MAVVIRMADFEDRRRPRRPAGCGEVVSIATGLPFAPASRVGDDPVHGVQEELFGLDVLEELDEWMSGPDPWVVR